MNKLLAGLLLTITTLLSLLSAPSPGFAAASDAITCAQGTFSSTGYSSVTENISCVPAPAGSYVDSAGAKFASQCAAGFYQPDAGQTLCLIVPVGTYSPQGSIAPIPCEAGSFAGATGSSACRLAPPGTYANSAKTDQVACSPGTYQPQPGQTACLPAPAGSFVSNVSAASASPCPAGYFQPLTGQTDCTQQATAGTYAPLGAAVALSCPDGSFSAAGAAACTVASPGYYANSAKTAQVGCGPGYYQAQSGQTSCLPSPAGSFVATANAVAAALCQGGFYQPQTARTSCIQAPAGTSAAQGASAADPCVDGTFSSVGAAVCTVSAPGSYVSPTDHTRQVPCGLGTYQPDANKVACLPAQPGKFVDVLSASAEVPCDLGYFQPNSGASTCNLAPIGSYVDTPGALAATPCPSGFTTSVRGASAASACSAITVVAPPVVSKPSQPVLTPIATARQNQSLAALRLPKSLKVNAKYSFANHVSSGLGIKASVSGPCKISLSRSSYVLSASGKTGLCVLSISNTGNAQFAPLASQQAIKVLR